jgi:hypothetical protein
MKADMKGIVFNVLEEVVRAQHGEEAWDDLLADVGSTGVYTAVGSYEDGQLLALVGAASRRLGLPPREVVRWFGRHALPVFAVRYPEFFRPHHDTRSFILTLNTIIHPEVQKLYPGATPPRFDIHERDDGRVDVIYHSARGLCALAEGLLEGTAAHYGEHLEITRPACTHRGDPACHLVLDLHRV